MWVYFITSFYLLFNLIYDISHVALSAASVLCYMKTLAAIYYHYYHSYNYYHYLFHFSFCNSLVPKFIHQWQGKHDFFRK